MAAPGHVQRADAGRLQRIERGVGVLGAARVVAGVNDGRIPVSSEVTAVSIVLRYMSSGR